MEKSFTDLLDDYLDAKQRWEEFRDSGSRSYLFDPYDPYADARKALNAAFERLALPHDPV